MIDVYWLFLTIVAALAVFAWMANKLSRAYLKNSILSDCIADMLTQPRAAQKIAEETREELESRGLWSSTT